MSNVSVVVTVYNRRDYIYEAVQSVLLQTYPAREIIVVDDASQEDILSALGEYKDIIIYIKNDSNRGPGACRNIGVMHASGDYIAFLDDDDIWLPAHLYEATRLLEANPSVAACSFRAELFGDCSGVWPDAFEDAAIPVNIFFKLLRNNIILFSSIVVRRAAVNWWPWFDETSVYFMSRRVQAEDYDFVLKLAKDNDFILSNNISVRYRVHSKQSSVLKAEQMRLAFYYKLKIYKKLALDKSLASQAKDRIILSWEEQLEKFRISGDRRGLKTLVWYGIREPILMQSTVPYLVSAILPRRMGELYRQLCRV